MALFWFFRLICLVWLSVMLKQTTAQTPTNKKSTGNATSEATISTSASDVTNTTSPSEATAPTSTPDVTNTTSEATTPTSASDVTNTTSPSDTTSPTSASDVTNTTSPSDTTSPTSAPDVTNTTSPSDTTSPTSAPDVTNTTSPSDTTSPTSAPDVTNTTSPSDTTSPTSAPDVTNTTSPSDTTSPASASDVTNTTSPSDTTSPTSAPDVTNTTSSSEATLPTLASGVTKTTSPSEATAPTSTPDVTNTTSEATISTSASDVISKTSSSEATTPTSASNDTNTTSPSDTTSPTSASDVTNTTSSLEATLPTLASGVTKTTSPSEATAPTSTPDVTNTTSEATTPTSASDDTNTTSPSDTTSPTSAPDVTNTTSSSEVPTSAPDVTNTTSPSEATSPTSASGVTNTTSPGEGTTHSETTIASNLDTTVVAISTQVFTTKEGCRLSDDSCATNGVFLNESCECLCQNGFAGVNCEVIGDNNVCTEEPDLCGVGQYCEADTKATNGKKYVCKCNPLEGYYGENKCAEGKTFTTVLHVNKINDEDAGYKYAYRDIYSAESKKIFEVLISVINGSLGKDATTRNVKEIIGIRLEEGSVRVTVVVIFPKDANINVDNIVPVLKQKILSYGSTTLQLDPNQFSVTESSPETCSEDFCNDNRGICKLIGFFPDQKPLCSCKEGFTGTQCDIVEGCELTDGSCENGGTFVKESCECLCRKNFAGFRCEVSTEKNPCTENPDLCQERGQYCESDTKITDGKEYVCKCNSLEGYVQKDGKCIEEEPFTTKLDVTIIDGKEATYKPAHRDINSAESRKVLDAVIPVIRMSLKNDPATETVIDVVGIRLENGSIGVTTMVIFPKEENVKEGDLTKVLKKEKLGNTSVEIELKQEKFNVSKPQSAGCSSKYCSNDGTCRLGGVFPDLRPSCSCARDFYGPTCDSVVLTPFIIAMIIFGTVAFLILAGVLVFCLFVRARGGRHKAGEKVSRADRLYASAWKTGPDILSHYLTEELDDKEADSETELSSVSDERMDQLVKDLKGSSFQMKRAKSVYQWESVKFNKPPSQPRYADNPSMLELKNSRDRRWYTSSNI